MPKELTHWIIADQAWQSLPAENRLKDVLNSHYSCYLTGAVLPDSLLHLVRGRHAVDALALADMFHDAPGNSFAPLVLMEQRRNGELSPDVLACLLGVITHICADVALHPYVYAQAGISDIGRHYALETALDLYFQQQGLIPPIRRLGDVVSPPVRETAATTSGELFDPQRILPLAALKLALDLHVTIQGMYGYSGWQLLARLLTLLPSTFLRQKSKLFYPRRGLATDAVAVGPWRHPVTGEMQHTTPDQLLWSAVERIGVLFRAIEASGMRLSALERAPGENLLTGLSRHQYREMGVGGQELPRRNPA